MDDYIEFYVEQTDDGYLARSFGASIMTEGATLEELKTAVCEALCCHFDDGCKPERIKLRFVNVTHEETLEETPDE